MEMTVAQEKAVRRVAGQGCYLGDLVNQQAPQAVTERKAVDLGSFREEVQRSGGEKVSFSPSPYLLVTHRGDGSLLVTQMNGARDTVVFTEINKDGGIYRESAVKGQGNTYSLTLEYVRDERDQGNISHIVASVGGAMAPGMTALGHLMAARFLRTFPDGVPQRFGCNPELLELKELALAKGVEMSIGSGKTPFVTLKINHNEFAGKETDFYLSLETNGEQGAITHYATDWQLDSLVGVDFKQPMEVYWASAS